MAWISLFLTRQDCNPSPGPYVFVTIHFSWYLHIFLTSVSCLCFHATSTSSTSSHLLHDTTHKKQAHWFEFEYPFCFLPVFTGPTCEFHCFITDLQYQQFCRPLWYFKRANTLRVVSIYWSSTLISLVLLLSSLQKAAPCFRKNAVFNIQSVWFWLTFSFWEQYSLNKTAAAVSAGF